MAENCDANLEYITPLFCSLSYSALCIIKKIWPTNTNGYYYYDEFTQQENFYGYNTQRPPSGFWFNVKSKIASFFGFDIMENYQRNYNTTTTTRQMPPTRNYQYQNNILMRRVKLQAR